MNSSQLIATGNFNFKQIGMARGSQYRCKGGCKAVFEVAGVHSELSGKDAQKFVNALGQKHRRVCECQKQTSNNIVPVVAKAAEDEIDWKPEIDIFTKNASDWSEMDLWDHLNYHESDHKLNEPTILHAVLPPTKFHLPTLACVFEHPTGVFSKTLFMSVIVIKGAFPHLESKIADTVDEAEANLVMQRWVSETMAPVNARKAVVRRCVKGAIDNIMTEARKNNPRKPWKAPAIKKWRSPKQLALVQAIEAYRTSALTNKVADAMMLAALEFV